jgi:hypothetical protein
MITGGIVDYRCPIALQLTMEQSATKVIASRTSVEPEHAAAMLARR